VLNVSWGTRQSLGIIRKNRFFRHSLPRLCYWKE